MRNQLVFTQERFEVSKRKGRQVTGQLEVEIGDNRALREQLHSLTAGMERRTKANEERKVKAQQRKRGDTRDMMAESKAKDDRIKSLESNLMQEKARLEEELRAARADYEEAAKESRRKTGRLQRRCLELEYRVAMQTKAGLAESGGVISREGAVKGAVNTTAAASSETSGSSLKTVPGFLLSTASVLPWRRGSMSSETSSTSGPATAGSAAPTPLAAAAAVGGPTPATAGGGRRATAVAAAIAAAGGGGGGGRGGGRGERGIPASGAAPTHPGRRSADRLPDPSRHNDSAPAWMRADLAVDTVHED